MSCDHNWMPVQKCHCSSQSSKQDGQQPPELACWTTFGAGSMPQGKHCIWYPCRYPTLHRPYRIPCSLWGCVALLAPACLLLVIMLLLPIVQASRCTRELQWPPCPRQMKVPQPFTWRRNINKPYCPVLQGQWDVLVWTCGAGVLGCVLYPLLQHARRQKWVPFEGCVHEFKVSCSIPLNRLPLK